MTDFEQPPSGDKDEKRAVFLRTLGELKTVTKHGETPEAGQRFRQFGGIGAFLRYGGSP